uniref:Uncharacterized protein n=1 Tax=Tanacetum cinerariifolium TaxID=118510 RepID=A0A699HR36_TANCI|nr:hypothetical protein [Tanacetum cinerariifolium]
MNSIEQCIIKREIHQQDLHNGLKRLNERKLQIQKCKVQEVKASDASSGDKDNSRIVSDKGNDQGLENQSNTSGDESSRLRNECNDKSTSGNDTDIRPSYDTKPMAENPRDSNSIRDSCLVALQNKQTELEKYMTFNDRTVDYEKLKLVKEKHDELVKHSLLTKSRYEGLVKEKTKVITDLKLKEEKDIDKMISMEKQLNFLNDIVYKRNQSIQTIHMLAPKGPTFNGRPTFANPKYLKKAQSEKPCLYEIPYDQSDPANKLVPDREETLALEKESRSKLNKDLVRPYDYIKLNRLYEISNQRHENIMNSWHMQMKQAYNVMTNNINHFKELVDQAWVKHSHDHFRAPTALDMKVLIKTCLMPLAIKTQNDSFTFVHELKQEMHVDLKYIESLENKLDKLKPDNAEFSNIYDILLQECVSRDLTKPVTQHSWPQVKKSSFTKPYDVNAPDPSRNRLKHVSFQSPKESVGSNDMVHHYYLEEAKKTAQLQKAKALNTKPSVQQSARLPNTANGNKPKPRNFIQQPRNWPPSMSSHVSNRTINKTKPPRNQNPFLKLKDLACPTCRKCIYSENHNEYILKYLLKVHSRASQEKDAQSYKTTKRYMPVEKKCDSKKHDRQILIRQKFTPNKCVSENNAS